MILSKSILCHHSLHSTEKFQIQIVKPRIWNLKKNLIKSNYKNSFRNLRCKIYLTLKTKQNRTRNSSIKLVLYNASLSSRYLISFCQCLGHIMSPLYLVTSPKPAAILKPHVYVFPILWIPIKLLHQVA